MKNSAPALRQHWTALRAIVLFTILLGIAYPLVITGVAHVIAPSQANGSMIVDHQSGKTIGSSLIGQSFTDSNGNPLPQYFQSRPSSAKLPSAAGQGYDGTASGGSNAGPNSSDLAGNIAQLKTSIAAFNGVAESQVPPDAVTASGSGLDADISPAYAQIQVARVAQTRGMSQDQVQQLVTKHTSGRFLGFIGEKAVNVLQLNLALDNK